MAKRNLLKKSVLVALGIGAITKSKAESAVKRLSKAGYLNVQEGKKLAGELLREARQQEMKLVRMVDKRMQKATGLKLARVKKAPKRKKKSAKQRR